MIQNIFDYTKLRIKRKRESGKESTADLYCAALNHLVDFTGDRSLLWTDVTSGMVDGFTESLRCKKLATNTVNSYVSSFRALFRAACNEAGIDWIGSDPFAHLRLRREETAPRALKIAETNKLLRADFSGLPVWQRALDLFIFCYLACGMPFVDLAYLTKINIVGKEIVYHRHKTGTLVRVGITPAMRRILQTYAVKGSPYLFPILRQGYDGHVAYKAALRSYNDSLKQIGRRLHLAGKLTSYVARHSWATEALRQNVPVAVISQALGHTSEKTTRIYLDSLDQSVLNKANRKITRKVSEVIMGRA